MIPAYNPHLYESPIWDEGVFMPREQLDRRHLRRIQRTVKYAYEKVLFYRKLYDNAGLKPEGRDRRPRRAPETFPRYELKTKRIFDHREQ